MNEDDTQNQDKDQLIAYFQDLTSIDDIGQCLELLETANWNLNDAVQNYFTNNELMNEQPKPQIATNITADDIPTILNQVNFMNNNNNINSASSQQDKPPIQSVPIQNFSFASIMSERRRYLEFEIEYKNTKKIFRVADTDTIEFLKKVCESEFNIPYDQLILKGWKDRDPSIISTEPDKIKLKELNLPLKTTLYLLRKSNEDDDDFIIENVTPSTSSSSSRTTSIRKTSNFEHSIYDIVINTMPSTTTATTTTSDAVATTATNNKKNFQLKYDSDKKFSKLKYDLTKLILTSPKNQEWFWKVPEEVPAKGGSKVEDDILISDDFVPIPRSYDNSILWELKQYLDKLYNEKYTKSSKDSSSMLKLEFLVKLNEEKLIEKSNEIVIDDDTEYVQVDDDEDDEEDDLSFHFTDATTASNEVNRFKRKTLISDDFSSESDAIEQFIKEFSDRYGSLIPLFFVGSLDDSIRESLLLPVSDRKLLAIYLHSDNTIYSNIFCSKILCNEEIINFLSCNFVLWPWDLTTAKNEEYFFSLCTKYLGGSTVIHAIKQLKNRLPALILLTRVRSNNEIVSVIEADTTKENLMMNLIQYDEMFQQQRSKDLIEENQREERERIKREQDYAYQASLDYDKAKRQKQEEESNKEIELKREQEQMKLRLEREFNDRKAFCSAQLKPEPKVTSENSKQLTTLRIKELDGSMLQRRFYVTESLEQLLYYLGSLGYFDNKYKLLTTWPRRDLAVESKEKTFQDLKLYPQETIILEEKDE